MERIISKKNQLIRRFRLLARDRDFRREQGEFLCDGSKLLHEALDKGAKIREILWRENGAVPIGAVDASVSAYLVPEEVFSYVSPLENSPGPLFSVAIPRAEAVKQPQNAIVLENIQDPGNVGTVLRTAAALGCGLVILTGDCADPYNPKTVRASMGAIFRQRILELPLDQLTELLRRWNLPLLAAALSPEAEDIRTVDIRRAAIAVGNEGHGLSSELLAASDKQIILPMTPGSESLNAAVAASILMWEMTKH